MLLSTHTTIYLFSAHFDNGDGLHNSLDTIRHTEYIRDVLSTDSYPIRYSDNIESRILVLFITPGLIFSV